MVGVEVSSNAKEISRRLRRVESKISKNGEFSVGQVARIGRDLVKQRMPRQTGESANTIVSITRRERHDEPTAIITQNRIPHIDRMLKGKSYEGSVFNLPLWMMISPKALHHFRTGNVGAMRNVPIELFKRFGEVLDVQMGMALKI